ncbi:MAG: TonB-dependent receptor [Bacteroidia bacterium]
MAGKSIFSLVFSILFSLMLHAQVQDSCSLVFSGIVLDVDNKEVVTGATVYIHGQQKGAKTNTEGIFTINNICAGSYKVSVTQLGFDSVSAVILFTQSITDYVFRLHTDEHLLHEVVISGQRKEEHSALSTITLDEKKLAEKSGKNLGALLKDIEGVTTYQTGASISKPVIHGLHSQRILILNNGIRQEGQQWGTEHAPEIDPAFATEISVIKGANTVRFGPEALGGIIMLSPKPLFGIQGLGGNISTFGGANNGLFGASALAEGSLKHGFFWRLHGSGKKAGNTRTPNYYVKNTGFREAAFSAAAGFARDKYSVEAFYSVFGTRLGIFSGAHIGNLTDLQNAFTRTEPLEKAGFTYNFSRPYQQITHNLLKLNANLYIAGKQKIVLVYGMQANNRSEYDKHKPLNDSLAALNQPELNYKIVTHTADATYEFPIRKIRTTLGISAMQQQNNYKGRFFIPNFLNRGGGVFSVLQWNKNKLYLEAGLRYDIRKLQYYFWSNRVLLSPERNFSNFSGSAGINYRFSHHWDVAYNLGLAWRPPSPNELYSRGLHHGAAAIEYGNENLAAEQSLNNILNIHYWHNKYFDVHFTTYANTINNYIYLSPKMPAELTIRGAFPAFEYKQTKALLGGMDANIEWRMKEKWQLNAKGMYLYGQDLSLNQPLFLMPANRVSTSLEYSFKQGKLKDAYLRAGTQYVFKQSRVPANADYVAPPKDYILFSLEAGTVLYIGKQPVEINLEIENLTNNAYRDYMNRMRYFTDEMGRDISLRIKIPFGKLKPAIN